MFKYFVLFFRNYCLHDPTSNADLTYRVKIKFSFIHSLYTTVYDNEIDDDQGLLMNIQWKKERI